MSNQQDLEHLRLLSIFHYVAAGLTALFACFPIFHVVIGVLFVSGALNDGGSDPPPAALGWVFILVGGFVILTGWTFAFFIYKAGRALAARRSRTFCLVIAGLQCLVMPYGTILGVFTIVVLLRDSVIALFDEA